MDEVAQRVQRVAESFLENEALTDELDDETAQVVLEWAVDRAKVAATGTAGLNDARAEEAMAAQLKAVRRLMRQVNKWLPEHQHLTVAKRQEALAEIQKQAQIIYGSTYTAPTPKQQEALLQQSEAKPQVLAAMLRNLFEPAEAAPMDDSVPEAAQPHRQAIHEAAGPNERPSEEKTTPETAAAPTPAADHPRPDHLPEGDHGKDIEQEPGHQPSLFRRAIDSIFGEGDDKDGEKNGPHE